MVQRLHASVGDSTCILFLNLLSFFSVILTFVGCRSVPVTERTQLMLSSSAKEKEAGEEAYAEYRTKYKRSDNAAYNEALARCGNAIVDAVDADDFEREFIVLETPVRNAFCLPGGKVVVYSGMMDEMRNEAELAFIVAHEVGHAVARHFGERTSWQFLESWGGLFPSEDDASDAAFGRDFEFEADRIGMTLMAKAGYDPAAAVQFWTRFSNSPAGKAGALMNTHPDNADRIAAMEDNMNSAQEEYAIAPNRKDFGVFFP